MAFWQPRSEVAQPQQGRHHLKWREMVPPPAVIDTRSRNDDDEASTCESDSSTTGRSNHYNLDRFLEATCPSVHPQYLPKSCRWDASQKKQQQLQEVDPLPYFMLGELWDSFDEWSAYGAGVPITLSGQETVIQYYVPYLSAIQLYTLSGKRPSVKFRRPGEESDWSDSDHRDSCSEASSDYENDRAANCWNCQKDSVLCYECGNKLEGREWCGDVLFQYFEALPPHARVPLTDKIASLARGFPELRSLRSAELLPASWMSIAWYPIYRIPTGPTLRDLQASFLTFHCLSTSLQDGPHSGIVDPAARPFSCSIPASCERDATKIYLEAFGLAHYKLRGSIWASTGNLERRRASSLVKCAESWLRRLNVKHPDFEFFQTH